jgi:hypothetical protein
MFGKEENLNCAESLIPVEELLDGTSNLEESIEISDAFGASFHNTEFGAS